MSIPPALAPTLQALLQARYGPEQREECAGWRGAFEDRDGDGVLVAARDVEAFEVRLESAVAWCVDGSPCIPTEHQPLLSIITRRSS